MIKQIENLKATLHPLNDEMVRAIYKELSYSELLEHWDLFNNDESLQLFLVLNQEDRSALLADLPPSQQEILLEGLSTHDTKQLLKYVDPDDLVDLIQNVSKEIRDNVWNNLSEDAKNETGFLLRFDQDDAAGIMTPRYAAIRAEISVKEAINFVRFSMDEIETIYYLYVVDNLKRLTGVISLRQLLQADDKDRIGEIMEQDVISVLDETDQEDVAHILEDNDLIALPVVDKFHKLLGIVTFDDVIDVIREEQTEDVYKMSAMGGNTLSYLETSFFGQVIKRLPWLIVLLLAGTITTNVLSGYENYWTLIPFLPLFIPVITQTGGNTGTQSATLMIRGLATGELHFRDLGRVLLKETFVALMIGIITGGVILARSYFLPPGVEFLEACTIGIALTCVVLFSSLLGCIVPMILNKIGIDPTVAAGPLMSTVIDLCGLTIYFEIVYRVLT